MPTQRIALVGIDGGGKSTLARALVDGLRARGRRVAHLVCPGYHLSTAAGPAPRGLAERARTARALERLSSFADERGARALKGIAMFLQMRLYGPIEALLAAGGPEVLLGERHAVVDALAYAPLYLRELSGAGEQGAAGSLPPHEPVGGGVPSARLLAEARGTVDAVEGSGAFDAAAGALGAGDFVGRLRGLFTPPEGIVDRLEAAFGTTVPRRVLLLAADPAEAARRLAARPGAPAEMHETEADLAALAASYERALALVRAARPGVAVERHDAGGDVEALAARLVDALV
jgi:thymidylate kinase